MALRGPARCAAIACAAYAAGCGGPQSTLDPAGRDAERILDLFGWMTAGGLAIWLAVLALSVYATRARSKRHSTRVATMLILGAGVAFPTAVLTLLLAFGLSSMPDLLALPSPGRLSIAVSGEQYWWRVRYMLPDGSEVDLANEIRLPVGERIEVRLASADVIHSFWIPSLGGKMDMIPGRMTRTALEPTRTGVFRGACAEYCGTSHAFMNLYAVVLEPEAFDEWLAGQQRPAAVVTGALAERGARAFQGNGCGACHTIRGTRADGVVGPDLTHVGSRVSIAAGMLPTEPDAISRWIAQAKSIKPGVHMPAFGILPRDDIASLAAYLSALE